MSVQNKSFFSFIGLLLNLVYAKKRASCVLMGQVFCQVMASFYMHYLTNLNVGHLSQSQQLCRNMMIRHTRISTMLLKVLKMQWKNSGKCFFYLYKRNFKFWSIIFLYSIIIHVIMKYTFLKQALGSHKFSASSWNEIQSLYSNHRSNWFSPWNGKSSHANAIWVESLEQRNKKY